MHLDFNYLLISVGTIFAYVITFGILFAESGLFFGFFLPGDSFLISLGLLASKGYLSYPLLLIIGTVAAIGGDSVGYATGRRYGRSLFKEGGRFLKLEHLQKAEDFYQKHGKKTIVLARFTPIIRTFAPIVAGAAHMDYKTFLAYNIAGGIFWVVSLISAGYFLGNLAPELEKYFLYIVAAVIIISLLPTLKHVLDARRGKI